MRSQHQGDPEPGNYTEPSPICTQRVRVSIQNFLDRLHISKGVVDILGHPERECIFARPSLSLPDCVSHIHGCVLCYLKQPCILLVVPGRLRGPTYNSYTCGLQCIGVRILAGIQRRIVLSRVATLRSLMSAFLPGYAF